MLEQDIPDIILISSKYVQKLYFHNVFDGDIHPNSPEFFQDLPTLEA